MAKKEQAAEAGDEAGGIESAMEAVAEALDVNSIDVAEPKTWPGAIAALEGSTGDLHAIHMRLAEMLPFLAGAIEQAEGDVKSFLSTSSDHL